jgi:CRP-like cAMP-binding protein
LASTAHPLDGLARQLRRHSCLSEEDLAAIRGLPHKLRTLEPSSYIIREGDPPTRCAVLVTGFAYRQKTTGDGARQIIALQIPGDALDFQNLFLDVSDHNVQMLTRGTVADVSRAAMQELALSRPVVGRAILIATLVEASIFREWVLNVGRRDSRSRIAHLLCEFAVRLEAQGLKEPGGFELPMTQEQLADATGLTSVHVNRVLRILELDGLITRNRRSIQFPSWQRIRDAGDFNRRYLHLSDEQDLARG